MADRPTRRHLIGAGAALLTVAATRSRPRRFFGGARRVGIQLYVLEQEFGADPDGTLAALAAAGVEEVELPGLMGRTAPEWRELLRRHALSCRAVHVGLEGDGPTLRDVPSLARALAPLGVRYVVLPFPAAPERLARRADEGGRAYSTRLAREMTGADWRGVAAMLNDTGRELRTAGLRFAYHNHDLEFRPVEGRTGFDLLVRHTDPRLVGFELDTGWAAAGGADPLALLDAYGARIPLLHLKDLTSAGAPAFDLSMRPADVGAGMLDWPRILRAAARAGVEGFFIEQEPPFPAGRLVAVTAGARYLRGLTA